MKRYLTYFVITAFGFLPLAFIQQTTAYTPSAILTSKTNQPQSKSQKPATVKPVVSEASAVAPPAPTKPAFNPNDPSTWPTCPAGDIVRADNGQCAASAVVTSVAVSNPTPSVVGGCGDNSYANAIFMSESHCSLTAVNSSSGDFGIGQSAGGLASACPDWQTDYTCQDNFFNNYAISRYGSWAAAYDFHIANGWW